jgi:putative tricarboxylic transport membrane protein
MRLNDAVWGVLLSLLAAAILVHVQSFPTIPGQQYGPALFPGLVAVGLAICGGFLIFHGLVARRLDVGHVRWFALAPWTRSRRQLIAFAVTLGVNVFYILVVDRLGFIPTGIVYLGALFLVFGVRLRWVLPLAVVLTLVIHTVFYKLLRVPLPWGVLQRWLW